MCKRSQDGKACGPDELSAEHIKHPHPLVVHCIRQLFILMVSHEQVPSGYSKGINVGLPLTKNKCGDHHLMTGLLHLFLLSPKFSKCLYLISVLISL